MMLFLFLTVNKLKEKSLMSPTTTKIETMNSTQAYYCCNLTICTEGL